MSNELRKTTIAERSREEEIEYYGCIINTCREDIVKIKEDIKKYKIKIKENEELIEFAKQEINLLL